MVFYVNAPNRNCGVILPSIFHSKCHTSTVQVKILAHPAVPYSTYQILACTAVPYSMVKVLAYPPAPYSTVKVLACPAGASAL